MTTLGGKTLFITGSSRGIGLAIALRAAADGANIVVAAKTEQPHPILPGTIFTAARQIEDAGGAAFPIAVDVRDEAAVNQAVEEAATRFGGIDILVNNASAISLTDTTETTMKRFDLMQAVNTRGTFLCSKMCLPYLRHATNPHILNLAPPINLHPKWFANHVAYTISKYGMSLCAVGMAEEFRPLGIAVNCLWPKTVIATAALNLNPYVKPSHCRTPAIMAAAAHKVLTRNSRENTGNFFIDEDLLREEGETDFTQYAVQPGQPLHKDWFLD
jgi:citronellol/citronellal dehydrogenase